MYKRQGILRICNEKGLPLDLNWLVDIAAVLIQPKFDKSIDKEQILDFLFGRLKSMYQDQGVDSKVVQSVLARRPGNPSDFDSRVKAVHEFVDHPAAETLIAANKRVANILRKSQEEERLQLASEVNTTLLELEQEVQLHQAVLEVHGEVITLVNESRYTDALTKLAGLKDTIDGFFDNVMVNADNVEIKKNRLKLLSDLRTMFLHIADVSLLN